MVAGIARDQRVRFPDQAGGLAHRQQRLLLRTGADHVRCDDGPVGRVDRRLGRVALDDALAGRHLCVVRVSDVGLQFLEVLSKCPNFTAPYVEA